MKRLLLIITAITLCSYSHAQQQDSSILRLESFVENISMFNRLYQQE